MKNKFSILYTIFASLIFIFAILFLSLNLYKEYSYGQERTTSIFNSIVSDIKSKSENQSTQEILYNLNKKFGNYSDFAYIQIKYNNTEVLKFPVNATEQPAQSNLTKKFTTQISSSSGSYDLICHLYLLSPYSIFYYSKVSFLIILIITILTVILIIYQNLKTEIAVETVDEHEASEEPVLSEITNTETAEITEEPVLEPKNEVNLDSSTVTIESDSQNDSSETVEIKSENNETENSNTEKISLPSEEVKPAELKNNESNQEIPEGLFNPVTGFGWEQYLLTRLDSEINRAIASEIDLSLFVFEFSNIEKDSDVFKNICNYLAIQFQFKDLLFEYKENCLVAMKISMNIDEAITFADKLYFDIKNIVQEKDCFIGISSRSIRMVSGERLLHEATEALQHAKDDTDSPIIAFRVDAEKYRQFLENKD